MALTLQQFANRVNLLRLGWLHRARAARSILAIRIWIKIARPIRRRALISKLILVRMFVRIEHHFDQFSFAYEAFRFTGFLL